MIKRIDWKTYLMFFHEGLQVNEPAGKTLTKFDSAIFYHVDEQTQSLRITFAYPPFIIQVERMMSEFKLELEERYALRHQTDQQVPELIDFINERYMDGRGIREV